MKITIVISFIGFFLSMCVLGVSLLLPILNGPRTKWSEAAIGIVPGAFCSLCFLMMMLVSIVMLVVKKPDGQQDQGRLAD